MVQRDKQPEVSLPKNVIHGNKSPYIREPKVRLFTMDLKFIACWGSGSGRRRVSFPYQEFRASSHFKRTVTRWKKEV